MNYAQLDGMPACASFTSLPGLFRIKPIICRNPRCTDLHITLRFEEVDRSLAVKKIGSRFDLDLDLSSGKVRDMGDFPAELLPVVAEFEKDLTGDILSAFHKSVHGEKEKRRKIEAYTMDPADIHSGHLFPFDDILNEGTGTGRRGCRFVISCRGVGFIVEDLYCPGPGCDCKKVHLNFIMMKHHSDGTATGQDIILTVAVPFTGRITLPENMVCTKKSAKELINHFFACYPEAMAEFRENYRIVKDMARRSLAAAEKPKQEEVRRVTPPAPGAKPGRNEPCICGSGKKYKKCCGR
jgi:hypothetical protein